MEIKDEIKKLHVMCKGIIGLEELKKVLKHIYLVGNPKGFIIRVPTLFTKYLKQVLE